MKTKITINKVMMIDIPEEEIDENVSNAEALERVNYHIFNVLKESGIGWELTSDKYRGVGILDLTRFK